MCDAVNNSGQQPELESVADAIPSALLILNRQGKVTLANTELSRIFGWDGDRAVENLPMWQVLPEGLRETVAAMQREVLIYGSEARRDFELAVPAAEKRLLEMQLSPIASNTDSAEFFVLTIREARDRQEIEHLKKLDSLKSNFLALISHELRTPLTSIRGAVHLLGLNEKTAVDPEKTLVNIIQSNSERLIRLVNNLLEMVAIDNGTFVVSRAPVKFATLAEQAIERCKASAATKFISLSYAGQEATGYVDSERVLQFMMYLLDNAIKFTPTGGHVTVSTAGNADGSVAVLVQDTGCGVPAHARERIFDRFYQVEDPMTRCCGGAGVGLYLARHIVQEHGGHIWVDNNSAGGSDFHATFPAAKSAPSESLEGKTQGFPRIF